MNSLLFVLFMFISIFILMQIYKYSTYHKYFIKMIPLLVIYGCLVGFLLFEFHFSNYFILAIIWSIVHLIINIRKQKKSNAYIEYLEDENEKKLVFESIEKTIKYHRLSSLIYITTYIISFLYFYNLSFK